MHASYKIGDNDRAIEYYEEALEINSKNIDLSIKVGKLYEQKREFDSATKIYKRILKHKPDNFTGLLRLGVVMMRNN